MKNPIVSSGDDGSNLWTSSSSPGLSHSLWRQACKMVIWFDFSFLWSTIKTCYWTVRSSIIMKSRWWFKATNITNSIMTFSFKRKKILLIACFPTSIYNKEKRTKNDINNCIRHGNEWTYSVYPSGNSKRPTRPGPPILGCWKSKSIANAKSETRYWYFLIVRKKNLQIQELNYIDLP